MLLTRSILARQTAERRALQLEGERQSEARLTDIATRFPGVMYRRVLSPDGQVSYPYLSNGITDLVGVPAVERLREPSSLDELAWDYILPEDRAAVRDAIRNSAEDLGRL
jgi:hypothetical protein